MSKKLALASHLVPGMVAAEDVYDNNDKLILAKDAILTDKMIVKLSFYNIGTIYIKDEFDVPSYPVADDKVVSYTDRLRETDEYKTFFGKMSSYIEEFKGIVNDIVTKNIEINIGLLAGQIANLLEMSSNGVLLFDMLHIMRTQDDSTYAHSINVALISRLLATWLNMSSEEVDMVTVSGMLHDIGKVCIPDRIIKKPDRLTQEEYEVIKHHTSYGYNILKNCKVDERVRLATLMHHERCDGSGYPRGLVSEQINSFSKIIAITDVYDAMTSARVYRKPVCPFEVIGIFESERFGKYYTEYMLVFLEHIARTYINDSAILSNGEIGEIVMISKDKLSRPLIKTTNGFVDLSERKDIEILNLL